MEVQETIDSNKTIDSSMTIPQPNNTTIELYETTNINKMEEQETTSIAPRKCILTY